MAKSYTKVVRTAGVLQEQACFPMALGGKRERAEKRNVSRPVQRAANLNTSWEKLMWQLAANYWRRDLFVTLTYRPGEEPGPEDRKKADRDVSKFNTSMRKFRKAHGQTFIAHWCTEHKHGDEDPRKNKRWHHHFVINATGEDLEDLRTCWPHGDVDFEPIEIGPNQGGYERIAKYMCKEAPETVGRHVWHHTRNIRYPEVETWRVEADEPVQAPHGSVVLRRETHSNRSGHSEYVRYFVPGWDSRPGTRARRRRRKR